jgi:uncharacterized protein YkwD
MRLKIFRFILWAPLALLSIVGAALPARAADDGSTLYDRTLLEQINNYRQVNGLNSLRFDVRLARLAKTHSFEMFQQKRVSHRNFDERFERAGSRLCVENVGWNYSTPLKQFDGWRHSSGHDENMLKEGVTRAGIAEVGRYVTFFACN